MQLIYFIPLSLILLSCSKPFSPHAGENYPPPLLSDSVYKRAYYFTYHKWQDAGVVSLNNNTLLFEVEVYTREQDSARFKKTQADPNAKEADSAIFYDQRHRPEIVEQVNMQFKYLLTDTVNHIQSDLTYNYPLYDRLFSKH